MTSHDSDWDDLDLEDIQEDSLLRKKPSTTSKFDKFQLAAIEADISKPLIITAGPGSGKTRTILERINFILQKDPAAHVLALTFTVRASQDMRNGLSPKNRSNCETRTIHSWCFYILQNEKQVLGMPSLKVCKDSEARKILKEIMTKQNSTKLEPYELQNAWKYIQKQKSSLVPPRNSGDEIYQAYLARMTKSQNIDYADFIGKTIELFSKYPQILDKYVHKYSYILVDEFQDLSISQFEILKMFFAKNPKISIVGDEDQSIYAFRGGTPTLFAEFREMAKKPTEVQLAMNYRSTNTIISAFCNVIKQNYKETRQNFEKKILAANTENMQNQPIEIFPFVKIEQEITFVVEQIQKLKISGVDLNEIAILCRVRKNILGDFVKELKSRSISCQMDKICKFDILLSYLGILSDCFSDLDFWSIINFPKRGLSDSFKKYFISYMREKSISCPLVAMRRVIKEGGKMTKESYSIGPKHVEKLSDFLSWIARWKKKAQSMSISDLIDAICLDLKMGDAYKLETKEKKKFPSSQGTQVPSTQREETEDSDDDSDDEANDSLEEKLIKIKQIASEFALQNSEKTLADFVAYYRMADSKDEQGGLKQNVFVSSVHQSKGLEFKHVFIVRLNEGVWPTSSGMDDQDARKEHVAEERRILFVAMSRAKQRLTISYQTDNQKGPPSRFLKEIQAIDKTLWKVVEHKDVKSEAYKPLPRYEGFVTPNKVSTPPSRKPSPMKKTEDSPRAQIPSKPIEKVVETKSTLPAWKLGPTKENSPGFKVIPSAIKTLPPKRKFEDVVDLEDDELFSKNKK